MTQNQENSSSPTAQSCATKGNGCIYYKGGYKYQLQAEYCVLLPLKPEKPCILNWVELGSDGLMVVRNGYAWDGPSGPIIETTSFMRGSLVHDGIYQLMREGGLDHGKFRDAADQLLRSMCLADGMWSAYAWAVYQGVRLFGKPFADPANNQPIKSAPESCAGTVDSRAQSAEK